MTDYDPIWLNELSLELDPTKAKLYYLLPPFTEAILYGSVGSQMGHLK